MADWTAKPDQGTYEIETLGPSTLRTEFADQSQNIRQKSATVKRLFIGVFTETSTAIKTLSDFFATKLLTTTFTIITYDPGATTPTTDEATVRFLEAPRKVHLGGSVWRYIVKFREA